MRHVALTCKHHPHLRWSCKEIAFTPGYGYNGIRNIFYNGKYTGDNSYEHEPECKCPPTDLILSPEEVELQKTHPTYDSPCPRQGCNVLRRVNGGHLCGDCGLSI